MEGENKGNTRKHRLEVENEEKYKGTQRFSNQTRSIGLELNNTHCNFRSGYGEWKFLVFLSLG